VYASRIEGNENLHRAWQVLKLFTDARIAAQTPFQVSVIKIIDGKSAIPEQPE
jgi:hypothetical protein